MSNTGKPFVSFTNGKLPGVEDLKDRFFEFLDDQQKSTIARVYNSEGIFDSAISLLSPGNDQISLTGSSLATDGLGNVLDINGDFAYCQNVQFENSSAVSYEVTLHVVEGPMLHSSDNTILVNARTGAPEYLGRMNYIGELGSPDSVDILGSTITLVIDSLCEAGVSHAGRYVVPYMKSPSAVHSDVGLPILQVQWVSGENVVVIDTTLLGQTAASTDPADYEVIVFGPTVRRNSTNVGVSGYVNVGTALGTGAGTTPSVFGISGQSPITISLSEINNAFANFVTTETASSSGAGGKTSPATAFGYGGSAQVNSNIYAFGGMSGVSPGITYYSHTLRYDTTTDTWFTLPAMSATLAGCACVARGAIIYVVGGTDGTSVFNTVRRFDTVSETWLSNAASLPDGVAFGTLLLSEDGRFLYHVGGSRDASFTPTDNVHRYDEASDAWDLLTQLPAEFVAVSIPNATIVGDDIYVMGGTNRLDSHNPPLVSMVVSVDCQRYNITSSSWTILQDSPYQSLRGKPACFYENGLIHLLCGDYWRFTFSNERPYIGTKHTTFSIHSQDWTAMPRGKASCRRGVSWGLVGGVFYTFGGYDVDVNPQTQAYAVDLSGVQSSSGPGACILSSNPKISLLGFGTNSSYGNLINARTRFGAARFADGIIIVGGIDNSGNYMSECEVYWPQSNTSQPLLDLPASRAKHKVIVLSDNKGEEMAYVLPGADDSASPNQIDSQIYSIGSQQVHHGGVGVPWGVRSSGPVLRDYNVGIKGSLIYFIGGTNAAGTNQSAIQAMDLDTGVVHSNVGQLPSALTDLSGYQVGASVYLFGATSSTKWKVNLDILDDNSSNTGEVVSASYNTVLVPDFPAIDSWDGGLFVTGSSGLDRYVQAFGYFELAGSAPAARTGNEMFCFGGVAYSLGGSSDTLFNDSHSGIAAWNLQNEWARESSDPGPIQNFKAGTIGTTVAFNAGDPFGIISYSASDEFTYVSIGAV